MARALTKLGKTVLQQKSFGQQGNAIQGAVAAATNKHCEFDF